MKVLTISGDKNLLEPGTEASRRLALQRSAVEQLDVLVWPQVHTLFTVFHVARTTKYDVVTAQDPFWRGLLAWLVARLNGAKLNIQVHTDLSAQHAVRHILAHITLRHADTVRAVSEKIRKQVEHMGVRVPIRVLPVFVDLPKFYSLIRRPHAGKNIVWIGRFEEEKNPLAAIEVLQQVLKVVPDARLTMIGTGSLGQKLSDRAANLPIMVPLGWQDPRIYLDTADVVLCASWHESWGASIVEALAAHVPVVAPDVGVAKEAGATVVPRERLAEAVTDVLKSGARGKLQLNMLSEKEWAEAWVKTL